jgi:hypothetical protein
MFAKLEKLDKMAGQFFSQVKQGVLNESSSRVCRCCGLAGGWTGCCR